MEEIKQKADVPGWLKWSVIIMGILLSGFALYATTTGVVSIMIQRVIHIGVAIVLAILTIFETACKKNSKIHWLHRVLMVVIAGIAVVATCYLVLVDDEIVFHLGDPSLFEIILGCLLVAGLLEITRRIMGPILPAIAVIALLYAVFGSIMPGGLAHKGYDFERLVSYIFLSDDGVFGVPTGVSATVVVMFVIFGSFLQGSGAGTVFRDGAFAIFGRVRGGPAKVAVVSSALFGTISGSAIANVATVGTFTIPLMKGVGYPARFAAGVEAVASTGGQIMPPIMGAGAFIMAQILGVSYGTVALAAVIPAILYFYTCLVTVDLQAMKCGMKGMPASELPRIKTVIREGWHVVLTLGTLIFLLVGVRLSPNKAALYCCILCVVLSWFSQGSKMKGKEIVDALVDAAKGMVSVALACATAGIVVGVLGLTGLGLKMSGLLVYWSGGSLLLLMILTMITGVILGMGLPTTGVYIILSVLAAPALIKLGVNPLSAHMFVFYYGVLAAITPPVALASYAAAGIAGADYMAVGWEAVKLGLAGFLMPFIFVFDPSLLGIGSPWQIVHVIFIATLSVTELAMSIQGAPFARPFSRVLLCISSMLLLAPGMITDISGVALFIVVIVYERIMKKRGQEAVDTKSCENDR
jgi:TRAP transporter 4TM/12TM fusion protein